MKIILLAIYLFSFSSALLAQDDFVDHSYQEYQEDFEAPESQQAFQNNVNDGDYRPQTEEKISPDPAELEKNGSFEQPVDEDYSEYSDEY